MSLRRIPEPKSIQNQPCFHPGHNPPTLISLQPGLYEHQCDGCGAKVVFWVGQTLLTTGTTTTPDLTAAGTWYVPETKTYEDRWGGTQPVDDLHRLTCPGCYGCQHH